MSPARHAASAAPIHPEEVPRYRGSFRRLYASELRLVLGRRRNQVLLVLVALVPLLIGITLKVNGGTGRGSGGPPFLNDVSHNGLFLMFTALGVLLTFLLPLAISIVSGDTVAGEANVGSLRYLLIVPVSRPRLLAVKFAGAVSYAAIAVLLIGVVAVAAGAVLFPIGQVTLLSGNTVSFADGIARALLVALYVLASLTGLIAIGLAFSTLTEVPIAAMAATVIVAVVSAILDALPQVNVIHPYLLTHHWLDFSELLRRDPRVHFLLAGLAVQVAYVAIAGSIAYSRFIFADITA